MGQAKWPILRGVENGGDSLHSIKSKTPEITKNEWYFFAVLRPGEIPGSNPYQDTTLASVHHGKISQNESPLVCGKTLHRKKIRAQAAPHEIFMAELRGSGHVILQPSVGL